MRPLATIALAACLCCCCGYSVVSLHTANSLSSRRSDMNSNKSPAAQQFASPLSTIIASPSPDKNSAGDDIVDMAEVKVSGVI